MESGYRLNTTEELLDVLENIDRVTYPERLAEVQEELSRRQKPDAIGFLAGTQSSKNSDAKTRSEIDSEKPWNVYAKYGWKTRICLFMLAIVIFLYGIDEMSDGVISARRTSYEYKLNPIMFVIVGFNYFIALIAVVSYEFIRLCKGRRDT